MPDDERDAQQALPLPEQAADLEQEQPPRAQRIFCNRNLRFDQIHSVGFDMDYTLAVYRQDAMDRISIEATTHKLIERGYPESLRHVEVKPHFPIRGLLVDTRLGNVLKTDRYRYPKQAFHGGRELTGDERRRAYSTTRRIRPGNKRYHAIDTLYALSEVSIYAAAIDVLDSQEGKPDYAKLFADVRASIDEAHQDGSIKDAIMRRPQDFVERDPHLPAMLHKLRSAGKHLFLLTNSGPQYTECLMSYLLDDARPEYSSWRGYFDATVVQARKPAFFMKKAPFLRSDDHSAQVETLERDVIYEGGNIGDFERMTGHGRLQVLYVGDHIYGDMLRAKKESSWRTLLVISELTDELAAADRFAEEIGRLRRLEQRHDALLDEQRDGQVLLKAIQKRLDGLPNSEQPTELQAERVRLRRQVDRAKTQLKALHSEQGQLESELAHSVHPFWGSPFHTGSELSSFGEQVERYACLYTDRATNLVRYSPAHYFRGPRHRMAHDL